MLTIISGLLVTALTGLTILAYKHPNAFAPLGLCLLGAIVVFVLAALFWDTAVLNTYVELYRLIPSEKSAEAIAVRDQLQVQSKWMYLIVSATWGYLVFLLYALPALLGREKTAEKKRGASGN